MNVVFDAYGTLLDVAAPALAVLGDTEQGRRVAERWRALQLEYAWTEMLTGGELDFWSSTERAARTAATEHGLAANEMLDAYRRVAPFPDAIATVTAIGNAGFGTYVYSNANASMLTDPLVARMILPHLGLRSAPLALAPARPPPQMRFA